ncbi:MAG: hypothetical protein DPW11_04390, partial [bacterium]|nr:hypothetical protein [bacterium]
EHGIDTGKGTTGRERIVSFRTIPQVKIDPEAERAIREADLIVLGPGDLYTNTVANLVIRGVTEAINKSYAKLVFVMNVMTKRGESYGYKASDYLNDLGRYLPLSRLTHVIVNIDRTTEPAVEKAYKKEGAEWVEDDLDETKVPSAKYQVIREKLLAKGKVKKEKGDNLVRSMVRHDSDKLAKVMVRVMS